MNNIVELNNDLEDDSISVFTDEDQDTLDFTQNMRKNLVINMTKEKLPKDIGSVRVLNELLGSMDSQVTDKTKIKLNANKNADDSKHKEAMLSALTNIDRETGKARTGSLELEDEFIPIDLVPGETSTNKIELDYEEIMDALVIDDED